MRKEQQVKAQHLQLLLQRAPGETGWTGSEMPVEITSSRKCDNQRVRDLGSFKGEARALIREQHTILCVSACDSTADVYNTGTG